MRSLIRIEARRMRSRRMVWVLLGGIALGVVISAVITFARSAAPDPGYASRVARNSEVFQECMRTGPPGHGFEPGSDGVPLEQLREDFCRSLVDTALPDRAWPITNLRSVFGGTTTPLILLAWVIGASFIGAEWRAGTIGALVTWEPRRVRVMIAKGIVAAASGALIYLAVQALLAGTLLPSALLRGTTVGADAEWIRGTVGLLGRGAAMAAIGGAIGFSLGSLGRNTSAALGIGFVYLAVVEGSLVGNFWPGLRRWLVVGNSIVFVSGESNAGEVFGRSPVEAGLLLALYAAVLVGVATAVFRTRDIS